MEKLTDNGVVNADGELSPFGLGHVNLATLGGDVLRNFAEKPKVLMPLHITLVVSGAGTASGRNLHVVWRLWRRVQVTSNNA